MNRYDKEKNIIRDFQSINFYKLKLLPINLSTISLFYSIHNKKKWINWIDSSAKNTLPPDFYNSKLKLMMDVMRIDDHSYVNKKGKVINDTNIRESKLMNKLINENDFLKEVYEKGNLIINADSGLRGEKNHNYNFYVDSFKRVVKKHIEKIDNYKNNHPGYKTIFFVLDESSTYLEYIDEMNKIKRNDGFYGELHQWWYDKNMIDCLKDSKIDFLVWMTPYKYLDADRKIPIPHIVIIDVKKIKYNRLISYSATKMRSWER